MSHFALITIIDPKTITRKDGIIRAELLEHRLEILLAPYDENLDVAPYSKICHCIESQALDLSIEKAQEKFGTLDELRIKYLKKNKLSEDKLNNTEWDVESWRQFLIPYMEYREKQQFKLLEKCQPLKLCTECKGSGQVKTTVNPESKWDWYVRGGRWTGLLSGYDPVSDPTNLVPCSLCSGKGLNSPVPTKCHLCDGKGVTVNWPYQPHDGDVLLIKDINKKADLPRALILPDGEWVDKEIHNTYGTWRERDSKEWAKECKALYKEYKNFTAVVIDCHY